MNTLLIVALLVVGLLAVASFVVGRITDEVESARDTEYLELEGAWIRYNVIGAGPPVVLVHGWLSSSRVWERVARRLGQRFTVYTLDLKGFGDSDKPLSGYGVRYGSRILYAFCAHFGLARTAIVAHDLSGDMAVKLVADHPDLVGRLVLVSVPADEDQIDLPTPLWLATLPFVGPLFYALGRSVRFVRTLWLRPFVFDRGDLTDEAVEDAGKSTPTAVRETLEVTRREISGGRLTRQARSIKIPVLVVAGEEDQIVDPQSLNSWAQAIRQSEVHLMEECGHMPMLEHPTEFNARMLAFLTGDDRYMDTIGETANVEEQESPEEDVTVVERGPGPLATPDADDAADDETEDLTPPEVAIDEEARFRSTSPESSNNSHKDLPFTPEEHPAEQGAFEEHRDAAEPRLSPQDKDPEDEALDRSARDPLSEIPQDLFEWPEDLGEPRNRRRSPRRENQGRDEPGEPPL